MTIPGQPKTAEMDVEQAVTLTDRLVSQHTGRHLSSIQIAVLREAWLGSRKTYGQLAQETQYSASYVQQGIGPKLWRLLSQITGEKVTKRTVKVALSQYFSVDAPDSSDAPNGIAMDNQPGNTPHLSTDCEDSLASLAFPENSVPLQSPFYIERGKHEYLCYQEVNNPGCLIRIKAPRQMGKSSLVNRILDNAQTVGSKIALLHFQQAEAAILADINRLLRWICANLAMQLGLSTHLDDYWDDDLGSKMSCNLFIQSHILNQLQTQLVIAFEDVNELLEYPQVAQEFLTLVRFWHERSKTDPQWRLLRLIMVHSTEIYISLDVNQSPLNVGLSVSLASFTLEQINVLVQRHHLTLSNSDIAQLHRLVGGHPYLTRLALYHLAKDHLTLPELLQTAATDVGIYHAHLHKYLSDLTQSPSLKHTFSQILASPIPIDVNQIDGFKLQSLGLIQLKREGALVSCALYEQYFRDRL
ncbi:MAG: AAA-like domain-containing protein [Cyanobacteria bacterium J06635_1]